MRGSAPPGWYPDGSGNERWWDGQQWTEHTVAPPTDVSPPSEPAEPEAEPKPGGFHSAIVSWPFGRTVAILSLLMFCGLPLLPLYLWRVGKLSARWGIGLAVAWLLLASGIVATGDPETDATEDTSSKVADKPIPNEKKVVLLFVTDLKDGDSWVASDGKEYRLGLVNAPESNETCGQEARGFTSEYLDEGFTVDAYSTDTYSRTVAEVFDKDGHSLNVALAKSGLGNGKYLDEFRHENPDLGKRLDAAFAEAPKPECQISAEEAAAAAAAAAAEAQRKQQEAQRRQLVQEPGPSNCTPGYSPCLAPRADWDCGEIGHPVAVTGSDPYRLDRDGDGTGCD